jgi:regulatory protein
LRCRLHRQMKRETGGGRARLSIAALSKVPRRDEYIVELSDGYRFRVSAAQLPRYGIDVGRRIDADEVPEIERAFETGSARSAALRLLKVRPRATGELRRELVRRKFGAGAIGEAIHDLEAAGVLDDRLFARLWIKERIERKGFGKRRIASELMSKGVLREIVEEELEHGFSRMTELAVALRAARGRLRRLEQYPPATRKRRLYSYLLRSGFNSETAGEAVESVLDSMSGEHPDDIE